MAEKKVAKKSGKAAKRTTGDRIREVDSQGFNIIKPDGRVIHCGRK